MKITVKYPRWGIEDERKEVSLDVILLGGTPKQWLEEIFGWFNAGSGAECNEFLRLHMRSMSVGDFVCLDGQWWQCASLGWKKVSEERVDEVMAMPMYDTWKDKILR